MKPGTAIEHLVKPIGRALNLPCYDEQGQLKPESGCAKRRDGINNFADSIYDIFLPSNKTKPKTMQFLITKTTTETFLVEGATDPKSAAAKHQNGQSSQMTHNESMNVTLRPTQPVRPLNPLAGLQKLG